MSNETETAVDISSLRVNGERLWASLMELAKIGAAAPETLVKMLEALAQVAGHAPDEARRSIAQVQLAALQKFSPENRSRLGPEQQLMLERTSA